MVSGTRKVKAIREFDRLRSQVISQELLAAITDAPIDLLSYEDVREKLHLRGGIYRGLQDIPLDKIVGSVGRYRDFTRDFLPRSGANRQRWATVRALAESLEGWEPIEAFKVDDVYFVKDGNHRVSAAQDLEMPTIQGYVTEVQSPVPLDADITPIDVIIKADYADFLECTKLDKLRPEQRIEFSVPGRYQDLLTHIAAHQRCLEQQRSQPVSWPEAVTSWYDNVYMPLIGLIREKKLLEDFPHRTEADLYAWVTRHEMELRQACDLPEVSEETLENFAEQHRQGPLITWVKALQRPLRKLLGIPAPQETQTPIGCPDERQDK